MSKVIIKVNTFMKTKEFTDICNFIYNQYKERDIVVLPPYCDVYVVDGKPEIKIDYIKDEHKKTCETCIHGTFEDSDVCDHLCKHRNKWEAKDGTDRETT